MLKPEDAVITQRQREAIMRRMPSTVRELAADMRLPEYVIRQRLKMLAAQQAVQIVGEGRGKTQVWGYYTGVPYVPQQPRRVEPPVTPYKTRWIGGHYPGVY